MQQQRTLVTLPKRMRLAGGNLLYTSTFTVLLLYSICTRVAKEKGMDGSLREKILFHCLSNKNARKCWYPVALNPCNKFSFDVLETHVVLFLFLFFSLVLVTSTTTLTDAALTITITHSTCWLLQTSILRQVCGWMQMLGHSVLWGTISMRYAHSTTYVMLLTLAATLKRCTLSHWPSCRTVPGWHMLSVVCWWLDDGLVHDTGSSDPSQGGWFVYKYQCLGSSKWHCHLASVVSQRHSLAQCPWQSHASR